MNLFKKHENVFIQRNRDGSHTIGKEEGPDKFYSVISEICWKNSRVCFQVNLDYIKYDGALMVGIVSEQIRGERDMLKDYLAIEFNGYSG